MRDRRVRAAVLGALCIAALTLLSGAECIQPTGSQVAHRVQPASRRPLARGGYVGGNSRRRSSNSEESDDETPPPPPSPASSGGGIGTLTIVLIVVGVVMFVSAFVLIFFCWKRRGSASRPRSSSSSSSSCWNHCCQCSSNSVAPEPEPEPQEGTHVMEKNVASMTASAYALKLGDSAAATDTFQKMDKDGNGLISQKEWLDTFESVSDNGVISRDAWITMFGQSKEDNGMFVVWDENGNGRLELSEWRTIFRERRASVLSKIEIAANEKVERVFRLAESLAAQIKQEDLIGVNAVYDGSTPIMIYVSPDMLVAEVLVRACRVLSAPLDHSGLVFSDTQLELQGTVAQSGIREHASLCLTETACDVDNVFTILQAKCATKDS